MNNLNSYNIYIDPLTGLYNRTYYLEYLEDLIDKDVEFSTFNIDLNNFKLVNDVYGHEMGDSVLEQVGERLLSLSNERILFCRFGGDEFSAVYQSVNTDEINRLGKDIDNVLAIPIIIRQSQFSISASVGVARFPIDSKKLDDLLKLADLAMYNVKRTKNHDRYLITSEYNDRLVRRRQIERYLLDLDVTKELFLEYQPRFDTQTDKLLGMEAFVRWQHPVEGVIYPNEFINVSEEINVIPLITKWVMARTFEQIKEWNIKYNLELKMSLNIADSCIHNPVFLENVKFNLDKFAVEHNWIVFEISEFSIAISPYNIKKMLDDINKLGIDIEIDNFGTDYIRVAELIELDIKTVKIDKMYVHNMENNKIRRIVKSLIYLANELGIQVAAQCVETQEQYDFLKKYGCDEIQGFYKSKPVSKEEFETRYLQPLLD